MKTQKHPKLDNGQPAISCFSLPQAELLTRQHLAHERAAALRRQAPDEPASYAAERFLWHPDFPRGLKLLVCDCELFRLTTDLPDLLQAANGGQGLDFWDYGYVADLLRELLAQPTGLAKGDRPNARRALAWAEQAGSMKRDYSRE